MEDKILNIRMDKPTYDLILFGIQVAIDFYKNQVEEMAQESSMKEVYDKNIHDLKKAKITLKVGKWYNSES